MMVASRRAASASHNDPDAAVTWIFEHLEDTDLNDPPSPMSSTTPATTTTNAVHWSNDELMMLVSFGYSQEQATAALTASAGNVEHAADWLFSHESDLDTAVQQVHVSANPYI
jgi:ubiquitin carboxyl-terminal hydrolase 5/13